MRYLGLALYAEGPTDYRFLRPILLRLCSDICMRESFHQVEINDEVLALNHPRRLNGASREDRIVGAAREAVGAWSVLFVHSDADGDAARARQERVEPAINQVQREFNGLGQAVAVVPVRETETWALWDGDALRSVLGTTLSDQALGLPTSAAAAERVPTPKNCLRSAVAAARQGNRRGKAPNVAQILNALGEQVSLARLRQLPAFALLERDLKDALRALNVLP
jgi:hypothetical protein